MAELKGISLWERQELCLMAGLTLRLHSFTCGLQQFRRTLPVFQPFADKSIDSPQLIQFHYRPCCTRLTLLSSPTRNRTATSSIASSPGPLPKSSAARQLTVTQTLPTRSSPCSFMQCRCVFAKTVSIIRRPAKQLCFQRRQRHIRYVKCGVPAETFCSHSWRTCRHYIDVHGFPADKKCSLRNHDKQHFLIFLPFVDVA